MRSRREVLIVSEASIRPRFGSRWSSGTASGRLVDVLPLLKGPIFARLLLDPTYFALGDYDPIGGTVAWPNGADFAPQTLWELPDVSEEGLRRASSSEPATLSNRADEGSASR